MLNLVLNLRRFKRLLSDVHLTRLLVVDSSICFSFFNLLVLSHPMYFPNIMISTFYSPLKDFGDGKGTAKALLDKIANMESEAQKSFMHRSVLMAFQI